MRRFGRLPSSSPSGDDGSGPSEPAPIKLKAQHKATPKASGTHRRHSASYHSTTALLPYREALLDWFEVQRDARGMPWRRKREKGKGKVVTLNEQERAQLAYEVWVSETMSQQTQVSFLPLLFDETIFFLTTYVIYFASRHNL